MDINKQQQQDINPKTVGPNTRSRAHFTNIASQKKSGAWLSELRRDAEEWNARNVQDFPHRRRHFLNWTSKEDENPYDREDAVFVDQVAHITKSTALLTSQNRHGDVLYEKQRVRELKERKELMANILEMEKESQVLSKKVSDLQNSVEAKSAALAKKSDKRACVRIFTADILPMYLLILPCISKLDLVVKILLEQSLIYEERSKEAEGIMEQVNAATAAANKKAKNMKMANVKESMLSFQAGKESGQGSTMGLFGG
jgi:hypothetical protein